MTERKRTSGLVGSAALAVWAFASYLSLFLGCVNVLVPTYLGPPADGVGRYLYFSTYRGIGEALHLAFWPCIWALERSGMFVYVTRSAPDFYTSAAPFVRRFGVPTGWEYFWDQSHPLFWWSIRALILAEVVSTGFLAYAVTRWWRRARRSRLRSDQRTERYDGEEEDGGNGGQEQ